MVIVTNREVDDEGRDARKGVRRSGKQPNPNGPHELRMAEAVRRRDGRHVTILEDELTAAMKAEVGLDPVEQAWNTYRFD
jgi:hypothetical protein